MHWQIVRAIRRRLQDERGVALLMALGILLVLSLGFATSIALTSSGARHAERSKADQKAYALAEEGVNNAISVIHANSDAAKDVDCYDPLSFATYQNLLTPARTNTRSEGSVSWSGEFFCSLPPPAGEGPFWKITSTATVNNPGGPGSAAVTRTTTAKVPLADALVPTTTVDYVPVETPTTSVTWVPTESVELQPVATYSLSTVNDGTGFSGGSFMYSFGDF